MKFEEVLPLMREGKKAHMKNNSIDGYHWVCGEQHLFNIEGTHCKVIIKIEKDGTHIPDSKSWGIPRWAIMAEDWEILE